VVEEFLPSRAGSISGTGGSGGLPDASLRGMDGSWNEEELETLASGLGLDPRGILARRIYGARLLGSEPSWVLHGGGNVSCKTRETDLSGEERDVLWVKSSGADLAALDLRGLVPLDLEFLRRLRGRGDLSDRELRRALLRARLDPESPPPSLETLLHAFLPDRFLDHAHPDVVCVLSSSRDGPDLLEAAVPEGFGVLPWIRPGPALAEAVAEFREAHPESSGVILLSHGLVTWAEDAAVCRERMTSLISRIEGVVEGRLGAGVLDPEGTEEDREELAGTAAELFPRLRGLLCPGGGTGAERGGPMLLEWRPTKAALSAAESEGARELFSAGPLTPDHLIRTKGSWLVCGTEPSEIEDAVARFVKEYEAYLERNRSPERPVPEDLDPFPRVCLLRGLGIAAFGTTKREARIAADIAERTLAGKTAAAALSGFAPLPEGEQYAMETWSLEQAKLPHGSRPPLAGRAALVTGAAGAIGLAVCRRLAADGAFVVLTDLEGEGLEAAGAHMEAAGHAGDFLLLPMDVTDEASVAEAFREVRSGVGGLDVVVPNAGIAHVASLADLEVGDWKRVVAVNQTGTMLTLRESARLFSAQGIGGAIVLVATKNVPMPGAEFGAYSASKAGAVQLARVAALELAPIGVSVNLVHPDAVFADPRSGRSSGLWDEVGPARMKSRGLEPSELRSYYEGRNLLGIPVTADHVAEAVAFFAARKTPTTGAALTVDGGHLGTFYR